MGGGNPDWAARWAATKAQPPSDGASRLSTAWEVRRSAGTEPPPRSEPAGHGIASGLGESSTRSPIGDSASNSYMEVPPNLISRLTPVGLEGDSPAGLCAPRGTASPPAAGVAPVVAPALGSSNRQGSETVGSTPSTFT